MWTQPDVQADRQVQVSKLLMGHHIGSDEWRHITNVSPPTHHRDVHSPPVPLKATLQLRASNPGHTVSPKPHHDPTMTPPCRPPPPAAPRLLFLGPPRPAITGPAPTFRLGLSSLAGSSASSRMSSVQCPGLTMWSYTMDRKR